ncbi:MAG: nucleotidyl transferase AbiEii/AbiGii toxin family protein [Chloroflexi bacterium]|nr:nucleotidyl transferase AbiEii/AbiGii toxin family protein [Chloroflexota bacterium]
MESLTAPHWETIDVPMRDVLRVIGQHDFASRFYLAGGTALALQLGHRRSIDLDFFSESDPVGQNTQQEILRALQNLSPLVVEKANGNFVLTIQNVLVGFFGYGAPLIAPMRQLDQIALASLADIGLMKLDALITRGSRKDFYDVFFIAREIPLIELFKLSQTKYKWIRDFPMLVFKSMLLFDNADRDLQPELLATVEWATAKNFFIDQAKTLRREWFGF